MAKYHINPETGRPNICRATVKECPIGGSHYSSKEAARDGYEAENESVPDPFTKAMMKRPGYAAMEAQVLYTRQKKQELADRYEQNRKPVTKHYDQLPLAKLKEYNNDYRELEKVLTEEEKEAMYDYTGITFDPINKLLRDREAFITGHKFQDRIASIVDRLDETVKNIDSFIAKAEPKKRILFRRLDQDTTQAFTGSEEWAKTMGYEPGQEITFASYSSTTTDPGYIARTVQSDENTSVVLVLKSTKGAPVALTHESGEVKATQDREREILLPRNVKYRVKNVERVEFYSPDYEPAEVLTIFMEECES